MEIAVGLPRIAYARMSGGFTGLQLGLLRWGPIAVTGDRIPGAMCSSHRYNVCFPRYHVLETYKMERTTWSCAELIAGAYCIANQYVTINCAQLVRVTRSVESDTSLRPGFAIRRGSEDWIVDAIRRDLTKQIRF